VGAEGFEIQVWDGGDGIAAEHWDQALRPFQRLDLARGGGRGHSGLGLAIADRVARDHGGELRRLVNDSAGSQGDGGLRFGLALRGRSLPPS
jgi:two-component system osmolarity sensor histidine kinase EnvZ